MQELKQLEQLSNLQIALIKRFGKEIIEPINSNWTKEDEAEFIRQIDEFEEKLRILREQREEITLFNGEIECEFCGHIRALFKINDEVSMTKYGCCHRCYVKYVEGREERWQTGWRPERKKNVE